MTKLTLQIPDDLVVAAKSEATARQISVSKLVSDFFTSLAEKSTTSEPSLDRLAPRTRRLAKCIPETDADQEGSLIIWNASTLESADACEHSRIPTGRRDE
jgi:hypothetical protein